MTGRGNGLMVRGLTVNRGELAVCRGIDLAVPAGEITVLLGANGAGKTTLLDGIAGVIPAAGGTVTLGDTRLDKLSVQRRAAKGLSYVTQQRSVFTELTVAQNIAVANGSATAFEEACALFPRLREKQRTRAGLLSGGEQQMLVIARALAVRPRTLIIDELSLGLSPKIVETLLATISELATSGIGVLLVEQYVDLALNVGTTAYVMRHGEIALTESCTTLRADREALTMQYLGSEEDRTKSERLRSITPL